METMDLDEFIMLYDDDYYESDSESGILMTDSELIEVDYEKQPGSDKWDIIFGLRYPIIRKSGDIITAKDVVSGDLFKAKVTRDRKWKQTASGLPVKIEVIK